MCCNYLLIALCRAHREYLDGLVNPKKEEHENSQSSFDECHESTDIESPTISQSSRADRYMSRENYEEPKSPYRGTLSETLRQIAVDFMKAIGKH